MFKWLAAAAAAAVAFPLAVVLLVAAGPVSSHPSAGLGGDPSVLALDDIPPAYLALYMGASEIPAAGHSLSTRAIR